MNEAVGFQGEHGAFSEEAIRALLGSVPTRGYHDFESVVAALVSGDVGQVLLPFENTICGRIDRVYNLLAHYVNLRIVTETVHPIEQCLIGLPGASITQLTRVASHPAALAQCRRFFSQHPHLQASEAHDTAGMVRRIVEIGDPHFAAIGPALAAERYGAEVLERGIQDRRDNFTRFLLIVRS
jgi:prephenate dehydratase